MPAAKSATTSTSEAMPGHWKLRRRLSAEVLRQAKSGPTPVRKSRNRPIGTIRRLYQSGSSEILLPLTASEMTGKSVPQRTAKQLASRIRLLKRKLDSREISFLFNNLI